MNKPIVTNTGKEKNKDQTKASGSATPQPVPRDLTPDDSLSQLQEYKNNYQTLFECAPVGYLVLNEEDIVKEANLASCTKLQVERNELLDQQLITFIDPADQEEFSSFVRRMRATGSEQKVELKVKIKEPGKPIFVRMKGSSYTAGPKQQLYLRIAITDITNLKTGQQQLQENNVRLEQELSERASTASELKKYAAIVQSANEAIISISLDEKVTSWNPAAVNIFGFTEQEMKGKPLSALVPADLQEEWRQIRLALRQQHHLTNYTTRLRHKNAGERWLRLNLSPLFNEAGQLEGAFAIAEDISKQKQAEEDFKRSQLLLQESQAAGLVGTFKHYVEENLVEWSDELYRIYGFEPGELEPTINLMLSSTCPPDRPILREKLSVIPTKGKDTFSWSHSICTAAGEERYIRINGRFKESRRGKGKVIVGTIQDITAAKKAEEALKQTNKELQQEVLSRKEAEQRASKEIEFNKSLTESSADGICAIDQEGTCIIWNTTLEEYTNLNRGQALGKKLTDVLPACGGEKLVVKVKNVLQGKSETLSGISFRLKEKTFDAILVPVKDSQGEQSGGLCIFHDISESNRHKEISIAQKLEQQKELLHAVLKAQEAERKRIAEVLHNGLGQLLYATKLNLESLTDITPGTPPQQTLPAIKGVLRLMDEAISETRIISHALMPTILEDFGLQIALEELCKKLTMPTLRFRLANFTKDTILDKNTEIAVYRMIQELLNNVIKHAEATLAEITVKQQGKKLDVVVQDNGKGFRYKRSSLSHGIGLSSIKSRLKLMNGKMKISSSNGTIVKISMLL